MSKHIFSKNHNGWFLALVLIPFFILSCSEEKDDIPSQETAFASDPLLKLLSTEQTGIDFENIVAETFVLNITNHINTSNGGGVIILDANNDGLQDIYLISSSNKNKLYLNKGDLQFEDVTDAADVGSELGFEIAATAVDINADGFMDIYICRAGPMEDEYRYNKLFIHEGQAAMDANNGIPKYTERAKEFGLDDYSASVGANFFDYDQDGDLDLYLLNYPTDFQYASRVEVRPNADSTDVEPILDPKLEWDSDRFYRNEGNGKFTDVSKEAGIWNFGYGLSISIEDFNYDGFMDVYVANDFIQPDLIYINNGDGTFTDKLGDYVRHTCQHSMGTELADFDNDGFFDIFAVDMMGYNNYRYKTVINTNSQTKYNTLVRNNYFEPVVRNVLQRNNGNGTFSDIGCMAGVYNTDWSWSGLFSDLDNDGLKDLLVTNGYRREVTDMDFVDFEFAEIKAKGPLKDQFENIYEFLDLVPVFKLRNFVFKNKGDWTFEDMAGEWMTIPGRWSNGAATTDLDNDGDLDYVVNNLNDQAMVYQNLAADKKTGNYLQFQLSGAAPNVMGIGATITIETNNGLQYQRMTPNRGIFSSLEYLLHFGLGQANKVDKVTVRWPDGKSQVLTNISVNQRIVLNQSDANVVIPPFRPAASPTIFKDKTAASGVDFTHLENYFTDFDSYFMQPWYLSELGPMMAAADVNGDGLTDVFIGNSFEQPSALFLQNANGKFSRTSEKTWEQDKAFEDHGALFFDADNDGDPDLYVISGGAEAASEQAWADRFYINDGKGNFTRINAIPPILTVGSRIAAHDYDGDGDPDLFVGGRVDLKTYPTPAQSLILRNEGTHFAEVTAEVSPAFKSIGMVTDLAWANVDADPSEELIVVGEWMPVTIFKNTNGKLQPMDAATLGLDHSNGLWNRLTVTDLDADGDLDLVTGNLGTNTRFKATPNEPLRCYAKDFDDNGSIDPIMAYYEEGKIYPLVQRNLLIKQIPSLKKKYIFAKDYANATIEDVYPKEVLATALNLEAHILESGWWENTGGKFTFHPFPIPAQVAPTFGILVHDFDQDSHLDILLAGNKYGIEVETGRCDSGNGTMLKGDGKGNFTWIENFKSGFWATGEVRDLLLVNDPNGNPNIIVSTNNEKVKVYSLIKPETL